MPFGNSVMDLPTSSGTYGTTYKRIIDGDNLRSEGYSTITYLSSTQIKVKLWASVTKSFD